MAFNGNESSVVTLTDAAVWTSNYRATIDPSERIAHFFGVNKLNLILEQEGCMGIRIYHGIENSQKNLVLVGVDANQNDIANGIILEHASPCPSKCSKINQLNS